MVEKIANIILERSFNKKLPNRKFVESIVEIISNEYGLYEYAEDLNIKTPPRTPCCIKGEYDYATRRVNIYIDSILRFYPDKEDINFFYLYIELVEVIIHEMEHARQHKIAYEGDYGFERSLIRTCTNNSIYEHSFENVEMIKDKLYFIFGYHNYPLERLAKIDGTTTLSEIARIVDDNTSSNLIPDIQQRLNSYYVSGYILGQAPSERYFKFVNKDKWMIQEFYDDNRNSMLRNIKEMYDLSERLRLGLPIYSEEMKRVLKNTKH